MTATHDSYEVMALRVAYWRARATFLGAELMSANAERERGARSAERQARQV